MILIFYKLVGYRIIKGYELYGDERCTTEHTKGVFITDDIVNWSCHICGYVSTGSSSARTLLCSKCANITNRCSECGKLKD